MMDTTTKGARITSPPITLGERGRLRIRDLAATGWSEDPASGGTWAKVVLLIVIVSSHLPRPRIDQHVDHVRQQVGDQHHQGDDHEDPLHQGVVELPEGVVEVEADPWVVENDFDQDRAGD